MTAICQLLDQTRAAGQLDQRHLDDELAICGWEPGAAFVASRIPELEALAQGLGPDGMRDLPQDGRPRFLQSSSGNPSGIRARDGRLWFATAHGVSVVDPAADSFESGPPPVVIEEGRSTARWFSRIAARTVPAAERNWRLSGSSRPQACGDRLHRLEFHEPNPDAL